MDEVRHGEVHDVVSPGQLQDHVRVKEVVALEETSSEAVVSLLVEEVGQELLGHLGVLGLGGVLHRVAEQVVFLAKLDALLPAVVALVQVGGDSSELDELVLLEHLRQRDVVEIVEGVDAGLEAVVVFLGDQEAVESLVDGLVVQVLH